jgi:tetratricopeptide (TPR) repeat protein
MHAALAAARQAEAATLWDVAAERYEACLSAIAGTTLASEEAELLTALGRCYWNLSEARTAWRTLRRAMALYREQGDGAGMARATLEVLRIWGPPDRQRAMADEALDLLGDGDPHLRARLLLRLLRQDEAVELASKHGFEDVMMAGTERDAWAAFDDGRVEDGLAVFRRAHELYARQRNYHPAAGVLRGAAFRTLQAGLLDAGERLAAEAVAYARGVHLRFPEQLALMDLVGVAFARADFARCEALIAETPGQTDFRADLYRLWIAELRGDIPAALALMVDPERGGGATSALSQAHAAAAGLLFHAGRADAARQALESWAQIARDGGSLCDEAPVLADCLAGLGSADLLQEIHEAYEARGRGIVYSTLQGRGDAAARGAIALRLGLVPHARAQYEAGLAWAERERCPIDAGHCLLGFARAALADADRAAADVHLDRAGAIFERMGARFYLDQVAEARGR